ncbi:ABC transporter permease [Heyndrickxia sp. NPDC080065]|uniref:ABC transporter permease n=1 Tax=Heyndrickxia sp. NPDC080065 TaxID=3390568 RepID=UPI003CFD709C
MSIYGKLTKKHLLQNKKRTILTLLGMILSISLITSIGTFLISFQQYSIHKTKSDNGSYHVKINHANHQLLKRLQVNPQIKKAGVLSKETYFLKDGEKLVLKTIDQEVFSLLPFHAIKEQNHQGIIIEKWVFADLKKRYNTEKSITLKDKEGKSHILQVHKIVDNHQNFRDEQGLEGFIVKKTVTEQKNIEIFLEVDEHANFQEVYRQLLNDVPKENIELNHPLIGVMFSEETPDATSIYKSPIYILPIGIVVIATFAFIFNMFQISITERIRDIALLRTVGATKRQIKKMTVYEMGIYGLISIPVGLILGIFGFWIILSLYQLFFQETEISLFYFPMVLSPGVLLLSSFIGLFALIISGLLPLKIANRASPLDFLRRTGSHRVLSARRMNRFLKNVVGIETVMAIRNIFRNRLRSFIIIFSLGFSMFLFIAFSSFVMMMIKSDIRDQINGDFRIVLHQSETLPKALWADLERIPEIKEKYIHYASVPVKLNLPISNLSQTEADNIYASNIDGKEFYSAFSNVSPITVENERFLTNRLIAGSINKKRMLLDHGIIYAKGKGSKSLMKVGDQVFIQTKSEENNDYGPMRMVKVSGIIELGQSENELLSYPEIIPSTPTVNGMSLYLKNEKDMKKVSKKLEEITANNPNLEIVNVVENQRNATSLETQIQILLYGFVIVIAFIGILNIINTTIMNIILRRREYATLQAIGMSIKSVRNMVIKEGLLFGLISGGIGMAAAGFIELLLALNGAPLEWMESLKIYFLAFLVLIFICNISALVSSHMLKNTQWTDKFRNE